MLSLSPYIAIPSGFQHWAYIQVMTPLHYRDSKIARSSLMMNLRTYTKLSDKMNKYQYKNPTYAPHTVTTNQHCHCLDLPNCHARHVTSISRSQSPSPSPSFLIQSQTVTTNQPYESPTATQPVTYLVTQLQPIQHFPSLQKRAWVGSSLRGGNSQPEIHIYS